MRILLPASAFFHDDQTSEILLFTFFPHAFPQVPSLILSWLHAWYSSFCISCQDGSLSPTKVVVRVSNLFLCSSLLEQKTSTWIILTSADSEVLFQASRTFISAFTESLITTFPNRRFSSARNWAARKHLAGMSGFLASSLIPSKMASTRRYVAPRCAANFEARVVFPVAGRPEKTISNPFL